MAASESKPFQFTLWHLAVVSFWLCVALALIVQLGGWGIFLSVALGCGLMLYCRSRWGVPTLVEIGVVLLMAGLLFALLLPAISTPRGPGRRTTCSNNLKQIGIALQNYHDTYGTFPPAYIADDTGRPMHSWRVLILPYLEQKALYDLYDFNEPWDGPNNRLLADKMTKIYACPSDSTPSRVETSYVAVVGPETAWRGERPVRASHIIDGMSNTILVVEVHNSGIHWMEPRDLHVTQMPLAINPQHGQGISSLHPNGANVVFADGSIHFLPDNLDPETLRAVLTIAREEWVRLP